MDRKDEQSQGVSGPSPRRAKMATYTAIRPETTEDDDDSDALPSASTSKSRLTRSGSGGPRTTDVSVDLGASDEAGGEEDESSSLSPGRRADRKRKHKSRSNGSSTQVKDSVSELSDHRKQRRETEEDERKDFAEQYCIRTSLPMGPVIDLRGREVIFAIAGFFFLSVAVGLIVVLATNGPPCHNSCEGGGRQGAAARLETNGKGVVEGACVSPACLRRAADMHDMMDHAADPCEDFWQYACGGYLDDVRIPPTRTSLGVDTQLRMRIVEDVRRVLEAPPIGESSGNESDSAEWKARAFYQRCLDEEDIEARGLDSVLAVLDGLGGWAIREDWNIGHANAGRWNLQTALQEIHFSHVVGVFFYISVRRDDRDPKRHLVQIDQSMMSLPDTRMYAENRSEPLVDAYLTYMETVATLFGARSDKVIDFANRTFDFERELAAIHLSEDSPERNDPDQNYNLVTIEELDELAPRIQWLELLKGLLPEATTQTAVLVTSRDYLQQLSILLDGTTERVMNYYMMWKLVLDYIEDLPKPFRDAAQRFNEVTQGIVSSQPRGSHCMEAVNDWVGYAVGAIFIRDFFPPSSKSAVEAMTVDIRESYRRRFEASLWLDNQTREAALEKLSVTKFVAGYQDFIGNEAALNDFYSQLKIADNASYFDILVAANKNIFEQMKLNLRGSPYDDTGTNPHDVNAFYYPTEGTFVFPAGILQSPYYEDGIPLAINYGAIGTTIGHELTHAFDSMGSRYGKLGTLENWWSNESWVIFEEKLQCVVDCYNGTEINGFPLDGAMTVGENMADIEGLNVTYQAYLEKAVVEPVASQQVLPGLDLTERQLFFLAFAQNFCTKRRPETMEFYLMSSMHAPEEIRVRKTLSQSPAFAEAFQCKAGKAMNPTGPKCVIW